MKGLAAYETAPLVRPNGRALPPGLRIGDDSQARAMAFFVHHTGHEGRDVRLRVFLARPKDVPRGSIILHPGRTEFIEKYFETIEDLVARGFVVLTMDPRGQGLSDRIADDPLKCFIERYHHYADDIGFVERELAEHLPRPHVLMGHSMGGLTVLQAVLEGRANPNVVVASAPMLGLWDVATPILKYGFRALDRLGFSGNDLPFQKQERGIPITFPDNKLTSDEARFEAWREYFVSTPELRVAGPSIRWLAESVRAMDSVNRNARALTIPALVIAPGADPIVDPSSIRDFAERAGAEVVTVVGARHEVFLEQDEYRAQFFDALDRFLEGQGI